MLNAVPIILLDIKKTSLIVAFIHKHMIYSLNFKQEKSCIFISEILNDQITEKFSPNRPILSFKT